MAEKFTPKEVTVGTLIKTSKFFVPKYQRYYSWTVEAEIYLEDIMDLVDKTSEFFTGPMIFSEQDGRLKIIDGQQRLITTSIILSTIRDLCNNKGIIDLALIIESKYLTEKEAYASGDQRLIPNRLDKEMFSLIVSSESREVKEKLAKQKIKDKKLESWRNMWKFYVYCYDKLKSVVGSLEQTESKSKLARIVEIFDKLIKVIAIEVKDDVEAYLIFETLNDRGLQLSISDLLKNYIFSKLNEESIIDEYEVRWAGLLDDMPSNKFVQLIRYYWISEKTFVRERELFRTIRESVHNSEDAKNFIATLETYKKYYNQIMSPSFDYWRSDLLIDCLDDIRASGFTQHIPIIFSLINKKGDPSRLEDRVWALYCMILRRMLSGKNPNEVEKQLSKICSKINRGDYSDIEGIFKSLSPTDDEIKSSVKNTLFKTSKERSLAKAILRLVNNNESGETRTNKDLTLEHVWAKSNCDNLSDPDNVHMIGNFTLLTEEENKKIGNKPIEQKLPVLKESKLKINQELSKEIEENLISTWGTQGIENRTNNLVNNICQILIN